jgi:hypothetical protein
MHPALLIAVMQERDREIARRTRHAWKRPAPEPRRSVRPRTARSHGRHRGRLSTAFARSLAFFS